MFHKNYSLQEKITIVLYILQKVRIFYKMYVK